MLIKVGKDLSFILFCGPLITISSKFWSSRYSTMFKKQCVHICTRQVWKVTVLMTLLLSMQILVRCLQMKFQTTADVNIVLVVRSDTPTFSLDVYYFSPLFIVQLIVFLTFETKQLVLLLICHTTRKKFLQNHYTCKL